MQVLIEILKIVGAFISIPTLIEAIGWLIPSTRKRRKLMRALQILSSLPEGYERDRWVKEAETLSKEVRLDRHKDFTGDDLVAWLGVLTGAFIFIGFLISEEFRVIFQGIHPIWDYFPVALSGFMFFLSIGTMRRRRVEKRLEAEHHDKLIQQMYQSDK